ncbi:MAG: MFS transporter, partial [Chloroflexota bacterium]|nr:MFS transporter [Chloroflexota bacterium]
VGVPAVTPEAGRPRGVYYGWYVIAVAFATTGLAVGTGQYAFGVYVRPLEQEFGWTRTQVNAALSLGAVSGLIAPLVGRLTDRFGSRRVMALSLLMIALSYLLRPFMTQLWQWYALNVLMFIGFPGATILPAGKLVGLWFERTRGRMMGLTTMGNNFGGLTMAPLAGYIVGASGWLWGYVAFGLLALLVAPAAALVVRDRPEDVQREQARWEGAGRHSEGRGGSARRVVSGLTVREALRSPTFYLMTLGLLLAGFTYPSVLTQLIPHMENEGVPVQRAALALSVLAGFGMAGKLAFGLLAERITARYALMLSLSMQVGCLVLLLSIRANSPLLWLFVALIGLPFGAVGALMPLIVQETFGLRHFASLLGLVNMATVVSSIVGPLLAGASFDATGSYRANFMAVMGIFSLGVVVLGLARRPAMARAQDAP